MKSISWHKPSPIFHLPLHSAAFGNYIKDLQNLNAVILIISSIDAYFLDMNMRDIEMRLPHTVQDTL